MQKVKDLVGQKTSSDATIIQLYQPTSKTNQKTESSTETLGYDSTVDFRPSTPPGKGFALWQSNSSILPSYQSRSSLALPLCANDIIGLCYKMSSVSCSVVASLPEITRIIGDILEIQPGSTKWSLTMGRILALEERTRCISAQVEELEKNTKDISKQYWKDNKRFVLLCARDLIIMSDVLSSEINEIMEVLSDKQCLLKQEERARVSETFKAIASDLDQLRQRVRVINSTDVDSEANLFRKFGVKKQKQPWFAIPELDSFLAAILILIILVIFSCLLISFFVKGNSKIGFNKKI